MRILVSGSTGLIGAALVAALKEAGHEVVRLVRRPVQEQSSEVYWNPAQGEIDHEALKEVQAAVHLAGENIASRRWTAEQKERIRVSRVAGTRVLCSALAERADPPDVLVCASAVGYYGHRGDEVLDESSPPGEGFLAEVCREWEAACDPARQKGIRVVNSRTGVVLSSRGGALPRMLTPFKLGLGGRVGSGKQYWSWIAIDDVVGALVHAISTETLAGPMNVTSPNPVTNQEFTAVLGRVLQRPTLFPLPAFAARLAMGEMADELLLASARVLPRRLQESGYSFQYPELESALRHVLGLAGSRG